MICMGILLIVLGIIVFGLVVLEVVMLIILILIKLNRIIWKESIKFLILCGIKLL